MANQYVQVPPNSTGLKMQTFENIVGANTVEAEAVALVRTLDNTEIGTATQPVRIDPTGTTVQPTSGTDNITQLGSVVLQGAQTASTDGTGANQVVRNIPRRFGQILSTTPLASNATFTSAWFDTNQTGDMFVQATVRANQDGANPAIFIEVADDTTNSNFILTASSAQVFANNTVTVNSHISRRYWRVRYVNSITAQTTFEIVAGSFFEFPFQTGNQVSNQSGGILVQDVWTQVSQIDGVSTFPPTPVAFSQGSSFGILYYSVLPFVYNGSSWDRTRTSNVFKTLAAVAVTAGTPIAAWTPIAGKKFRLMGWCLSLSVAGSVIMKDATTELIRTPLMAAGIGISSPGMGNGILSATVNNVLNIDVTASGSVSGYVFGTEE